MYARSQGGTVNTLRWGIRHCLGRDASRERCEGGRQLGHLNPAQARRRVCLEPSPVSQPRQTTGAGKVRSVRHSPKEIPLDK